MPPWWKFEYDNVISYTDQDIIEELNRGYDKRKYFENIFCQY